MKCCGAHVGSVSGGEKVLKREWRVLISVLGLLTSFIQHLHALPAENDLISLCIVYWYCLVVFLTDAKCTPSYSDLLQL